ncbi:DUF3048 domain-containing protein [Ornithinibacillus gellani]|uniref:DUF3048 domain-containing protein n=1 Tax=Ornithinibacillus gellani TaxID=2293253 RepID=UPI000F4A099D|nr:DUF3048 domain-containing protein [Ornithinibacillus gellani]TQS71900.1 DUF3048 domain-containing protein [Ornithinibacillus gellani]
MKKTFCILGAMLLIIVLSACSEDLLKAEDSQEKKSLIAKEKQEPELVEEKNDATTVYPLTGLEHSVEDVSRAVGIMVNNHKAARPQTGLSKADVVFEILAEGMITRFLALFQSEQPDVVGPVRSAREYYFDLAERYQALYVYHGAAAQINDMIRNRGIDHLNGSYYDNDGKLFKRASFRKAPHNSYVQFPAIYKTASEKGFSIENNTKPLPFLSEQDVADISGDAAEHIQIVYSSKPSLVVSYTYDKKKGVYHRSSDGQETIEYETDKPIELDNILIMETYHEVIDNAGRRKVDMDSGGNAYLLQKGKLQQVQWASEDGLIVPVKDGKPIGLVPGKTWINVVPSDPGIAKSVTFE